MGRQGRPVNGVHSTCQVARKKISQASFSDHVELLPAVSWKPPGEEETIDCPDIEATLPDRDLPSSDAVLPLVEEEERMDTTDDIAEETCFQAVEDDCRLLDNLLHREVGPRFMEDIERKRVLAQVCLQ
ncbi:hypothetical protein GW17_00056471 [Ensete ventricosum]|nr:hypothetical protein GW17_00056471 [Ensete ventricosum]